MATVFIEAGPKGRPEGSAIEDDVVEEQGDRVLKTFKTQGRGDNLGEERGPPPHVARVRHLNDKKIPDHRRPVQRCHRIGGAIPSPPASPSPPCRPPS